MNEDTKKNSHKEDRLQWKQVFQAPSRRKEGRKNKVTEQHFFEDNDKMIVKPHKYMMQKKLVIQ